MPSYLTQSEWYTLHHQTRPVINKVATIVDRWVKLGLRNLEQGTLAWGVGIISTAHYRFLHTPRAAFSLLQDFKITFNNVPKQPWEYEYIVEYPETPSQLPEAVYKSAYA